MRSFPTPAITRRKRQTENRKSLIFLTLTLLAIWGCGPAASNPIVVFGSPDSPRMQQAIAALRKNLQDAPLEVVCAPEFGDALKASLRRIQQLKPRLLVVLGTPALMAVAPVEKHLPVVFALVADPYFTGAAYAPGHPEEHQENLTGLASPAPLEAALKAGGRPPGPGLLGAAV